MSTEKMEELGFIPVAQPPYSPDLAPYDLFLFGYLKQHFGRKVFHEGKPGDCCGQGGF
jgi:transposase